MFVSDTLIERFNQAVALANAGQTAEALQRFERVLDPLENSNEQKVVTAHFIANLEMRKAYCLMDLDRYEEAKAIFEGENLSSLVNQLEPEESYYYHFSYANTLGKLGLLKEMDDRMDLAKEIAFKQLNDMKKCEDAYYWVLYWCKQHQQWQFLEHRCMDAHFFGVNQGSFYIQFITSQFACYAQKGLGKMDKARRGAEINLERLKQLEADPEQIREWEEFLESL